MTIMPILMRKMRGASQLSNNAIMVIKAKVTAMMM